MTAPAPVDKIGKFIRLLASDQPGEIVAATLALRRTLNASGLDLHWLAEHIEASAPSRQRFAAAPGNWRADLKFCAQKFGCLNEREQDFVTSLVSSTNWRAPSQKQEAWLADIAEKLRSAA
jgi:hypothetical protein